MDDKALIKTKRERDEGDSFSDNELCGPCREYDGIQEQCIAFCFQCVDFLCSNCTKEHCKNKKTRDHNLVHGNDKPKKRDVVEALKTLMYCQEHPTAEISHTCREHCAYICVHCITTTHKQCKDINYIDDKTTQQVSMNESLLNDLQSEIRITRKIIRSKKENIEVLAMDGRNIDVERKTVIDSIITNLRHLELISKENTQRMITEQTAHIQEEVKRFERIEHEQEVNQALANLVLKHGSARLKTVVVDFITKSSEALTSRIDQKVTKQEIRLKFERNTSAVDDFDVGKISVEYRKREEKVDQLESSSDELVETAKEEIFKLSQTQQCSAEFESSIPNLSKKTVSSVKQSAETEGRITKLDAVPKTTNLSLMKRQVSTADTKINVRTVNDYCTCSITRIIALSDNLLVLLDMANSKVKIFKQEFSFVKELCLKNDRKPIDICVVNDSTFAVVYKDARLVDIFELQGAYVIFNKTFSTEYNVISITCTLEGELMTLCSKTNTEIQLYTTDGCMKRRITKFMYRNADIQLKQATCIRVTSRNELLISNNNMVRAFSLKSTSDDTASQNWIHKGHGKQVLKQAGCITLDSEGNIYVCGKKSKNIHQISSLDWYDNREIITLETEPLSLLVDNVECRILIGCENDDYLHIRRFL